MPVLSMTHTLALEGKSASYDLAKRVMRGRERGGAGRERELEKKEIDH